MVWMGLRNLHTCLYSEEENSFDLPSQLGDQLMVGTSWECRWQGLGSLEVDTFPRPKASEKVFTWFFFHKMETKGHGS